MFVRREMHISFGETGGTLLCPLQSFSTGLVKSNEDTRPPFILMAAMLLDQILLAYIMER
jgi:hypothetical protein